MKTGHNFISADAFLKLKNIIWAFPYLTLMGLIWGYLAGASSGAIVGLAVAVAINICIGSATTILNGPGGGSAMSNHCKPAKRSIMVQKQPASDLNAVRYHKLCHQFDEALLKIENVLTKDPDYVEALFLKAQILWEGFEDCQTARGCLLKILAAEPDEKAVFHRWALNFFNELSEKERG